MKDKAKICPRTGQPKMKDWGIGNGVPPLTDDPENPFKPFATYEMEDEDDDSEEKSRGGLRKKISPFWW